MKTFLCVLFVLSTTVMAAQTRQNLDNFYESLKDIDEADSIYSEDVLEITSYWKEISYLSRSINTLNKANTETIKSIISKMEDFQQNFSNEEFIFGLSALQLSIFNELLSLFDESKNYVGDNDRSLTAFSIRLDYQSGIRFRERGDELVLAPWFFASYNLGYNFMNIGKSRVLIDLGIQLFLNGNEVNETENAAVDYLMNTGFTINTNTRSTSFPFRIIHFEFGTDFSNTHLVGLNLTHSIVPVSVIFKTYFSESTNSFLPVVGVGISAESYFFKRKRRFQR